MCALGTPPAQRYSRPERAAFLPRPARPSRSRGVPCESLDAPDNLPKKSRRQVALRQLQDEVPRMSNEAPAGLEHPLLETREGPALDGHGQDEPAQPIAEVVRDDPEQEAYLAQAARSPLL